MKIRVYRQAKPAPPQTPQEPPRRIRIKPRPWESNFTTKEILRELRLSGKLRSRDGRRRGNQYQKSSPRLRGGTTQPHARDTVGAATPVVPSGRPWIPPYRHYREEV